jgi:pyridoxal phosphate enzyme (YggS family)
VTLHNGDVGSRVEQVEQGLDEVRRRIERAARAAGRTDRVDLVVVTKTFPATDVLILARLGVVDIAENRDQEARTKRHDVESAPGTDQGRLRWHMIGQLQRNKANSVCRWADVVESVDRVELVSALGRAARAANRPMDVMVQVRLDQVERIDRGGAAAGDAMQVAAAVSAEEGLRLLGVMGVAPFPGDPGEAFGRLAAVSAQIRSAWPDARRISAGMSGDLEQAIAQGATQVRVGGAVLGARPPVQ